MFLFRVPFYSVFETVKSLGESPRVIFDSNEMLGTFVEHAYSPNGEYCAFTICAENQGSHEIMIIDVRTGNAFGNRLRLFSKFSCKKVAWSGNSRGFFIYVNISDAVCFA